MDRFVPLIVVLMVTALPVGPAVATTQSQSAEVTLTVSVHDAAGTPVSDANVTARWATGATSETTAANGKAFLDVPAGADVTLAVTHPEYVRNRPHRIRNATERSVDLAVYRRTRAAFTVVDAAGPVADARVTLAKEQVVLNATTNASGAVATGVIEAGNYTLSVTKPGYIPQRERIHLSGRERRTRTIQRAAMLHVTVTDDTPTPPVPVGGANVTVEGFDMAVTGQNGTARLRRVPANTTLDVTITKPGYEPATREVTIRNRTGTVNATIHRTPNLSLAFLNRRVVVGESLLVTVTDEYDRRVSNATILIDGDPRAETGSDGTARVRLDVAGEHTVAARTAAHASGTRTVRGIPVVTGTPTRGSPPAEGPEDPAGTATPPPEIGDGTIPVGEVSLPSFGIGLLVGVILVLAVLGIGRGIRATRRGGL